MIRVVKFIAGMRFFVLIPVIGLAITALTLFIKGGIDLISFLSEIIFGMEEINIHGDIIVKVVKIVHLFLVGTTLFITSLGLYELFIEPLPLSPWLQTHNIEELELNLVGLTIVVLAVNFLSVIFLKNKKQPCCLRDRLCLTYCSAGLFHESAFYNDGK
jgi:uncharacterized membrane protein YqhA